MNSNISILNASWDGLDVKYVNLGIPRIQESLIIGVAIYPEFDCLSGAYINHMQEYLLFTFSPYRFKELLDSTNFRQSKFPYQTKIINPSILYMANLLLTEIESPKALSEQFACSIATVIITHCFVEVTC
jgi:hypothetical protein